MNIWELPKEHYNWESPITKIYGDIHNEIVRQDEENCTYAIEHAIGYKVDKEELIKALQYDREQYDKGYKDGAKETFVEELEKIKEEINNIEPGYNFGGFYYCQSKVLDVIDERLAELKGENK